MALAPHGSQCNSKLYAKVRDEPLEFHWEYIIVGEGKSIEKIPKIYGHYQWIFKPTEDLALRKVHTEDCNCCTLRNSKKWKSIEEPE